MSMVWIGKSFRDGNDMRKLSLQEFEALMKRNSVVPSSCSLLWGALGAKSSRQGEHRHALSPFDLGSKVSVVLVYQNLAAPPRLKVSDMSTEFSSFSKQLISDTNLLLQAFATQPCQRKTDTAQVQRV